MNQDFPKVQNVRNAGSIEKYLLTQWVPLENKNIGLHEKDINNITDLINPNHYRQMRKNKHTNRMRYLCDVYSKACPILMQLALMFFTIWELTLLFDLPAMLKHSFIIASVICISVPIIIGIWMQKNIPNMKYWV